MAEINFKHKQLVLHPSELDIKGMRLRRWLELGLFESSGSSVNAEGLTTTCSLPAAINGATASLGKALEGKNQRSCPGKDGNTGTPRKACRWAGDTGMSSSQTQELFVEWGLGGDSLKLCHLSRCRGCSGGSWKPHDAVPAFLETSLDLPQAEPQAADPLWGGVSCFPCTELLYPSFFFCQWHGKSHCKVALAWGDSEQNQPGISFKPNELSLGSFKPQE